MSARTRAVRTLCERSLEAGQAHACPQVRGLSVSPPTPESCSIITHPCRLRTVELVCRRFRELSCNAPQLHLTAVALQHNFRSALARARSLAEWLVRRGGPVRLLDISVGLSLRSQDGAAEGDGLDPNAEATDVGDSLELLTETLLAVTYCAAHGALEVGHPCWAAAPFIHCGSISRRVCSLPVNRADRMAADPNALQDLRLQFDFMPAFRFSSAMAAALAGLHRYRWPLMQAGTAVGGLASLHLAARRPRLLPPASTLLQAAPGGQRALRKQLGGRPACRRRLAARHDQPARAAPRRRAAAPRAPPAPATQPDPAAPRRRLSGGACRPA